jgi:hypothetical protein
MSRLVAHQVQIHDESGAASAAASCPAFEVRASQRVVEVGGPGLSLETGSPDGSTALELIEAHTNAGIKKPAQGPLDPFVTNEPFDVTRFDTRLLHQGEVGTVRLPEDTPIEKIEKGLLTRCQLTANAFQFDSRLERLAQEAAELLDEA